MIFEVFNINSDEGKKKYSNTLLLLNITDPFFAIEYLIVFCEGLDNLICFLSYDNSKRSNIFMVGYKKPIIIGNEITSYFDFITPYGYSGPFFSEYTTNNAIQEFWKNIDEWYSNNNVVTEFIRFNLHGNQIEYSGKIFPTMLNIKGRIIDEENQWKSFDRKVRKNYNKAIREKLACEIYYKNITKSKIDEFLLIYTDTMIRTKANERFLYSIDSLQYFIDKNEDNCLICTIYHKGIPISSEFVLVSKDSIYSFLGGTDAIHFDKRPNDLLKVELIKWARNHNKVYFILGGGYGKEDGIFNYKKSFFPNDTVNYYTGRKILNNEIYNSLVKKANLFRLFKGLNPIDLGDTTFFPIYNKGD